MTLRILHITPYYLPDVAFGGPVFSVSSLCEALVKQGVQVTVYTVGYEEGVSYPQRTTLNGVEVVYFRRNAGSPCQVSWQLWHALQREALQFDAVHLHTWWNVLIFRSIRILLRRGIPVVLSPRGMMSDYSFTHRKTWVKRVFQEYLGIRLLQRVALHATSAAEAGEMAYRCNRDADEVHVMPNLLNLKPLPRYEPVEGGYTLGFLSRLHHKKGIEVLLDAVARTPEVQELVIGGRGDEAYEAQLRQQIDQLGIGHRVRFVGWVDDAGKPAFFRQFQVFVLPSFNENFANVVAEAWAAGKPVIVSNEVGLSEYVQAHEIGWICQPEVANLADAMRTAWQERHLWPQMGAAALRLVNMSFSDEKIVDGYLHMYRRMVAPVQPPAQAAPGTPPPAANYILGINAHHADASAAIFRNGILVAAIEEERLRRVKHWAGFPSRAIQFCLREAGVGWQHLDAVAIGRDPMAKWATKTSFMLQRPKALGFAIRGRLSNAASATSAEGRIKDMAARSGVKGLGQRIKYVEHHRSHLASAFYASGLEEAALLSVDGSGDFTTTMMGIGRGTDIEILDSIDFPHSLGIFYTAFTQLLGFPYYGDEYKVMGLAPYGRPVYFEQLKQVVQWHDDGTFRLHPTWFRPPEKGYITYDREHRPMVPPLFSAQMEAVFGRCRQPHEPLLQHHKDLAASVQHMLEETIFHMLRSLHQKTGLRTLCLAGGVAQNSVANGKITRCTPFEKVYVPAAGHDAGLSIGAALYVYHQMGKHPRTAGIPHAYTGSRYSDTDIEQILQLSGHAFRRVDDDNTLYRLVADRISQGGVVGWFRGRSEFGPRALGNRSILADPRRPDAKDLLNQKIKRRESFRPFAPSVLADYASEYFEFFEESPFMEKVFPIRKDKQGIIPAVTHVDGTGRLQTVCQKNNPDYYALIDTFRQLTGVPILLNTSFNENEPIVNSPEEALDCFERTAMDMLVIGPFVIAR